MGSSILLKIELPCCSAALVVMLNIRLINAVLSLLPPHFAQLLHWKSDTSMYGARKL
jgi:hypothetical protein